MTEEEVAQRARNLLKKGHPIRTVANALGVPRSTLYKILGRSSVPGLDENARTQEEYLFELSLYADQYATTNVLLLGDPPLYRSALARKRRNTDGQQT